MQLPLRNFTSLVSAAAAAVQGAARQLLDLSPGSVLRAVLEANASLALWLQWLVLQVLQMTRAATSAGGDLDSWMADFSLTRLPAVAAAGSVTFSRFTPTQAAFIPVGTTVRTADATQTFTVTADATNAAWSADQNGYVLAAGLAGVTVPAAAQAVGAAGNVQAGAISLIAAAIVGVDSVTNAFAFTGGLDAEADAALRARFRDYINSRSRATPLAIGAAVAATRQGLSWLVQENTLPNGSTRMGSFVVTVDDGSGAPSAALLAAVANSVEAVRPAGTSYAVVAPTVVNAAISLTIATASPTGHADAVAAVTAAIAAWVNALPIGATLAWSRIAQIAYGASADVVNVTGVQINGATADLVPPATGVITTSSVLVA